MLFSESKGMECHDLGRKADMLNMQYHRYITLTTGQQISPTLAPMTTTSLVVLETAHWYSYSL